MAEIVKRYESEGRWFYFDENTPHLPALHFEATAGVWIAKDTWELMNGMDKANLKALDKILKLCDGRPDSNPSYSQILREIEQVCIGALS